METGPSCMSEFHSWYQVSSSTGERWWPCLVIFVVFVVEPTNSFNRSRWIVSSMGFVLSTRYSSVNVWNCYCPIFCAFLTTSTADGSAISLLSRTSKTSLSSSNGLPSSSITLTSEQRSFLNAFCTLVVWSRWTPHLVFQRAGVCLQSPQSAQQPQGQLPSTTGGH